MKMFKFKFVCEYIFFLNLRGRVEKTKTENSRGGPLRRSLLVFGRSPIVLLLFIVNANRQFCE